MDIPDGVEDMTAGWLTRRLRECGVIDNAASVASRLATQINEGIGFTGRVYRVELEYDGPTSAPGSLIVKLHSTDPVLRVQVGELGIGAEVDFYRDLAPDPDLRTPGMYFGEYDPVSHRYCLAIEDLAPAPVGDSAARTSLAESERLVRGLARLHARWWNDPRLERLDWLQTPSSSAATWQRVVAEGWERIQGEADGGSIAPDAAATIEAMLDAWPRIADHLSGPPFTLVHGDFRHDNLCFPEGMDGDFVAFDWQLVRRGSGAFDLGYLLPGVDISEDREHGVQRLVEAYHAELLSAGVEGYPLDQLLLDYRVGSFEFVWVGALLIGVLDTSSERGQLMRSRMTRRVGSLGRRLDLPALAREL